MERDGEKKMAGEGWMREGEKEKEREGEGQRKTGREKEGDQERWVKS